MNRRTFLTACGGAIATGSTLTFESLVEAQDPPAATLNSRGGKRKVLLEMFTSQG